MIYHGKEGRECFMLTCLGLLHIKHMADFDGFLNVHLEHDQASFSDDFGVPQISHIEVHGLFKNVHIKQFHSLFLSSSLLFSAKTSFICRVRCSLSFPTIPRSCNAFVHALFYCCYIF